MKPLVTSGSGIYTEGIIRDPGERLNIAGSSQLRRPTVRGGEKMEWERESPDLRWLHQFRWEDLRNRI